MAKTKVLYIQFNFHTLVCYRDNAAKYNPYLLYLLFPAKDKYGYPTMHRRKLVEYGDMASIMYHVHDMFRSDVLCKGTSDILAWNKQYCKPV